jgi:phosphoribosyl-ATP pyrophosphohydrolase
MNDIIAQLEATIQARINSADESSSYVSLLHNKGLNKILEKVGEESTELILAAKDYENGSDLESLPKEAADVLFHIMVMLSHLGLSMNDVTKVLASRTQQSGLEEKASRA